VASQAILASLEGLETPDLLVKLDGVDQLDSKDDQADEDQLENRE